MLPLAVLCIHCCIAGALGDVGSGVKHGSLDSSACHATLMHNMLLWILRTIISWIEKANTRYPDGKECMMLCLLWLLFRKVTACSAWPTVTRTWRHRLAITCL